MKSFLDNLPLATKLLLNEIHKDKKAGAFTKSDLPIRCIKQKLNLTRLSIEVEWDEVPSEILVTRTKVAYQIATYPCLKVLEDFSEINRTRKAPEAQNETLVECVKSELEKLDANSLILKKLNKSDENLEIDPENCELIVALQIEPEKEIFENFYKSAQLTKCKIEEFSQLESLKKKIFEKFLAATVKMETKHIFDEFKKRFMENVSAMAEKQLKCILNEIYK